MIRRLLLPADELLLRECYRWDEDRPQWWREMDGVFNRGDEDDFVRLAGDTNYALISIFNEGLIGVVIVQMIAPGFHEAHLCARRGADAATLTAACATIVSDLFNLGMIHGWVWVAEKNIPVRRICDRIGMVHDGVVMWKGAYRGRVIRWLRYSVRRERVMEAAA